MSCKKQTAIILVNYNGLNDTIECIRSLAHSSVPAQIIVVDNCSKMDEAAIIAQMFLDVKTIRLNKNLGFAGGNNVGIQWALDNDFEYIVLLNNDTIVQNDFLEKLLSEADEETIAVPYMYYHAIPNELWYGGGRVNKWTGNVQHVYKPRKSGEPFTCSFVTGCCFLAHCSIWQKIGLLADSFFMYHEDTDFSIRLMQHGVKIKVVPSAKIFHKVGKSSGGYESSFCIYYNTRNRLHIISTYKSFFYMTAKPFTLLSRLVRMVSLIIRRKKEWRAYYKGICDACDNVMGECVEVGK